MDTIAIGLVSAAVLIGIATAAYAVLKAWSGWLDLKRLELCRDEGGDRHLPPAGGRIEIADLKERVRKLEAIAAGIDL
jgi:hypothetical protein